MVGPIYDSEGDLRGAIQFVNKCSDDMKITQKDIDELQLLLPTMADVFRTADKVRVIGNTMVNMSNCLIYSKDKLEENLDQIESNRFSQINSHMS